MALTPTPSAAGVADCSIAKRLIDGHRSHVKATGTNLQRVTLRRLGFLPLEILVTGLSLILDDPDMCRGRRSCYVPFGCFS